MLFAILPADGAGLANSFDRCLASAGAEKTDVTYINAHGTSTAYNDKFETMAIKVISIDDTLTFICNSRSCHVDGLHLEV